MKRYLKRYKKRFKALYSALKSAFKSALKRFKAVDPPWRYLNAIWRSYGDLFRHMAIGNVAISQECRHMAIGGTFWRMFYGALSRYGAI